jgi:hypothetical protein
MLFMRRLTTWPGAPGFLVLIGVVVLALPQHLEGPTIIPISPPGVASAKGHALSVLDTIALIPLVIGALWLQDGLWRRRKVLAAAAQYSPLTAITVAFASGLGLGLLLASAFSVFFWWWAIGAVLFAITLAIAVAVVGRSGRS